VEEGMVSGLFITSPGRGHAPGDVLTFSFHGGGATESAGSVDLMLSGDMLSSEPGGLVKIGSGRLRLDGAPRFGGLIDVTEGELDLVTHSLAQPVRIHPGARLYGNFSSDHAIEVLGTLVPGNEGAGGITGQGELTVRPGSEVLFSFREWDQVPGIHHAFIQLATLRFAASPSDPVTFRVDAGGVVGLPEINHDFVLIDAGETTGFSSDAVDLQFVGSAPPGSWRLFERSGQVILAYRTASPSVFDVWAAEWGVNENTGAYEDLTGDGIPNILAFVFGHTPDRPLPMELLRFTDRSSSQTSLRFSRTIHAPAVGRLWLDTSVNLVDWESVEIPLRGTAGVTIEEDTEDSGVEHITVRITHDIHQDPTLFGRLRFEPFPGMLKN